MLVLTRKQNEKIKIGESITITVLRMKGKGVRLGIQAPENMNVLRGELVFDIEDDEQVEDTSPINEPAHSDIAKSGAIAKHNPRTSSGWSNDSSPGVHNRQLETPASVGQVGWCI